MLLCGEENLREVVLCPMNQRAEDLMMGAPSQVTKTIARAAYPGGEAQLKCHCGAWRGFAILGRYRRRNCDQSHRPKVGHGIVQWMLVEGLILREDSSSAEQKLIAVWRCARHARRADHPARANHVFDDYRLAQCLAHSGRQDSPNHVSWASRGIAAAPANPA
jgi:hypothetical protein